LRARQLNQRRRALCSLGRRCAFEDGNARPRRRSSSAGVVVGGDNGKVLAFDRSVRRIDEDGWLYVSAAVISKANVCDAEAWLVGAKRHGLPFATKSTLGGHSNNKLSDKLQTKDDSTLIE
jgi:hypothetical protein